ncbi:MAG TPA: ABC transporter ATP-binding protein/permease [Candidatus Jeotgalibaca pullicola]|nr:ABC transporter ATP-binding protein/permease [Candidatus Jeotgalibaca pullicola]
MNNVLSLNKKGFALMYTIEPTLVWVSVIQGSLEALYPFIPFYFTSRILDLLLKGAINNQLIWYIVSALLSSFFVTTVASGLAHTRESLIYRAMDKKEMLLNKKIIHMDYQFVEDTKVQEKLSNIRMNEMTGGIGMFRLFNTTKNFVKNLMTVIIALLLIIPLLRSQSSSQITAINMDSSWIVALFFLSLLVYITLVLFLNKKAFKKYDEYIQGGVYLNNLVGAIFPILRNYNSGKEIRIYNQQSIYSKLFDESLNHSKKTLFGINYVSNQVAIVSTILSYLILSLSYVWVIVKALNGAISPGTVIQYTGALSLLIRELPSFLEELSSLINNSIGLQNLFDFLEMKGNRHEGTLPVEKRLDNEYTLEARNVSFKYPGTDEYVLKDVNITLSVGEKLAIVGMNGSGKTTFIKLLCRLYDPTEGEILLNGIDIRKYDYQEYLRLLSVVFQDFQLYAFQLGENVSASKNMEEERVRDALQKSGFSKRLEKLKDDLNTYLYKEYDENGIEISGGEAQKIAMARAIYKQAPIVILDEPTAALDPLSEFEMYTNFAEVTGNRTTIYISHRLSSCRFCDTIAVFDKGKIIQRGSHKELVQEKDGKYYELWQAQAQYYMKDESGLVQEVAISQ